MRLKAAPSCWIELPEVDDFLAQRDAEALGDLALAALDERTDVGSRRRPVVDDEVTVNRRHPCAARLLPLQTCAIDQRARGCGNSVGHAIARRIRVLKNAAGARHVERLRSLAERERAARDGP